MPCSRTSLLSPTNFTHQGAEEILLDSCYLASVKFLCLYQKSFLYFSPFKQIPAKYSAIAKGRGSHEITIFLHQLHSDGTGGRRRYNAHIHSVSSLWDTFTNSPLQEPAYREVTIFRKMDWEWTIWLFVRFSFDYIEEHNTKNVGKSDTMHYSSM